MSAEAKIARSIATQSAVLLKNDAGALPLAAEDLASLVLIGPTAGQLAAGFLGERAYGFEDRWYRRLRLFVKCRRAPDRLLCWRRPDRGCDSPHPRSLTLATRAASPTGRWGIRTVPG